MSTPEALADFKADRPAERALFHGLFDDAAVFPPGLAPLPQAVTNHVAHQSCSYADLVGRMLLPAFAIEDFLHLAPPAGLSLAVIAQPGHDVTVAHEALSRLHESPDVTVTGVEIGWTPQWHQARGWGASLSIEVPGGADLERALADLQAHADDPGPVQAKFRTGSTQDRPVPTPTQLATFIRACIDHDLGFKLTGGLHHAISHTSIVGSTEGHPGAGVEEQFGFLNVIAATRWALAHGAEVPEMKSLLAERDPRPILDIISGMSEADASVVRAFFTAFGCCGVMDPIGDLVALGLIKETAV